MYKIQNKSESLPHQAGSKHKSAGGRAKALVAVTRHSVTVPSQWQAVKKAGPSQEDVDKQIRILSDRIYAASSKLMPLLRKRASNTRTMNTPLPMLEGQSPMFMMYYPNLALFGYALGG